jgi:hypothetical protein
MTPTELAQWRQYKACVLRLLVTQSKESDPVRSLRQFEAQFLKWYLGHCASSSSALQTPTGESAAATFVPTSDLQYHADRVGFDCSVEELQSRLRQFPLPRAGLVGGPPFRSARFPYLPFFSGAQEARLRTLYTPQSVSPTAPIAAEDPFYQDRNALAQFYDWLGGTNNHLGVPPRALAALTLTDSSSPPAQVVECFGTPFNTTSTLYCSPLPLEKERFGSLGSFFSDDFRLLPDRRTVYLLNPPYSEAIMQCMADKLLAALEAAGQEDTSPLVALVVLPVWDSCTQRLLGLPDKGRPFAAFEQLSTSRFCQVAKVLHKDQYRFYDYFSQQYLDVSHSHILLLSTVASDASDVSGSAGSGLVHHFLSCWRDAVPSWSERQSPREPREPQQRHRLPEQTRRAPVQLSRGVGATARTRRDRRDERRRH